MFTCLFQDLREECIKLKMRVFDLERQNRTLCELLQEKLHNQSCVHQQVHCNNIIIFIIIILFCSSFLKTVFRPSIMFVFILYAKLRKMCTFLFTLLGGGGVVSEGVIEKLCTSDMNFPDINHTANVHITYHIMFKE